MTSVTEPSDSRIFRDVSGTFQVPLYLTHRPARARCCASVRTDCRSRNGTFFTAKFRCMVPYSATTNGAAPIHPARPSLYGHGLLGDEGEVSAGHVRDMASEHDFVMCATQWTGMAEDDYATALQILADFSNFPKFPERLHQGYLNFLFLGRLMIHANGFASEPGLPDRRPVADRHHASSSTTATRRAASRAAGSRPSRRTTRARCSACRA